MPRVAVCIPTFRRPRSLARLLDALARLETEADVRVIVADNDGDGGEGLALCRDLGGYRWPLTCVSVTVRGVVAVRNALMAKALERDAEFIAMIDDDEWPAAGWLDALLAMQARTAAGAVGGTIRFDGDGGGWAAGFDGVSSIERPDGPIAMLVGAGNLLVARAAVEPLDPPWFDPQFGASGGEDRDFFERLKRAGVRFAWAQDALAYAELPQTRLRLDWVMRRAFRIGNTEMRILRKYGAPPAAWFAEGIKMFAALLSLPVASVILLPFPNRAADALRRWFRNLGKLAALCGRRHNAYAADHDR